MMMNKPYSESSDQNRAPILEVIRPYLRAGAKVLEIASGTGQHAVYFGQSLPAVVWQASDVAECIPGICAWRDEAGLENLPPPITLDVRRDAWPTDQYDAVFSANSAHIMHVPDVEAMFAGIGRILVPEGVFMLYGPFNYDGAYSSASNARFDLWLKGRDPLSGIRDAGWLDSLARDAGLERYADHQMPVNNQILVWRKI